MVAFVFVLIGGFNWLLVALNFNLIHYAFGGAPAFEQFTYFVIGISAVYLLLAHSFECKLCANKK